MSLTKIGSIGINTGIAFAGVTTITTLNGSDAILSVGGTVNFVSDVSIGGSVSIGGTLTYEDVTNIDSVGLITARNGITINSGGVNVGGALTVTTSHSQVGIFTANSSGANIRLFDDDTESKIRTVDGRLQLHADDGDAVVDSEIRFLVDNNIQAQVSAGSSFILGNDPDTFIGHPAGNTLAVTTQGSERIRIDGGARILYGKTTNRQTRLGSNNFSPNIQIEDESIGAASLTRFNDNISPFRLVLQKGRGTIASPAIVQTDDLSGQILFSAHDGSNFCNTAKIDSMVDGAVGVNSMPGNLIFATTAAGAFSVTERLRITSDGNVGINSVTPAAKLDVNGTVRATSFTATQPEYLRVAHTTNTQNQSLSDNTTHWIQFGSAYDDTKSGWTSGSSNYYTTQEAGYFLISTQAVITSNTANSLREWELGVEQSADNGSSYSVLMVNGGRGGGNDNTDTDTVTPSVTMVQYLPAGRRIRVRAYGNTDGGTWQVDEDLGDPLSGHYGADQFDNQKGTRLFIARLF